MQDGKDQETKTVGNDLVWFLIRHLHHHHHPRGSLAAETRSGRALALSPGLVQEWLAIDIVPVSTFHGRRAVSVPVVVGAGLG